MNTLRKNMVIWPLNLIFLGSLLFFSRNNFLLFHMAVEFFSISIAMSIFVITWNSKRYIENDYFILIGISFLFIGAVDFLHALSYKGMNIFHNSNANLPTQLWIIARYLESTSFLVAPLFIRKRLNPDLTVIILAAITVMLVSSTFLDLFPVCYEDTHGLTDFKKISEYVISAVIIASIILLFHFKEHFERKIFHLLLFSYGSTIISEIAFTFYIDVYGFSNILGHYFKILAFYLFYLAIIKTGLERPFELIFKEIKENEKQLSITAATDHLTGLSNRRACFEQMKKEIAVSLRRKSIFSVCLIDLDMLKHINDVFGHLEGDEAIRTFAAILKNNTRDMDSICRIGGDEFIIIFADCSAQDAENYIRRIENHIGERNREHRNYALSFSYGITEYDPEQNLSIDAIIEDADRKMYRNKSGKKITR